MVTTFSSLLPISERNLYADNVLSIKRFGASTYRVSHCRKLRRSGYEKLVTSGDKQNKPDFSFDGKRDNNISRARTAVWSIALSNPFTHYVTLTFDKKQKETREFYRLFILQANVTALQICTNMLLLYR